MVRRFLPLLPVFSAVFVSLAAGAAGLLAQHKDSPAAQDKQSQQLPPSVWQLTLSLDAPNLAPPAVQWAVLDNDPVPAFRERIKKMQGFYQTQLEQAKNEAQKQMTRNVQIEVHWDAGFRKVTGDKLYLLTGPKEKPSGVSSNSPPGKKWIATKIVHLSGKPACWCLPVDVQPDKPINVTLAEDNTFDLAAAMDEALGPEKKEALGVAKKEALGAEKKKEHQPMNPKEPSLFKAVEKALSGASAKAAEKTSSSASAASPEDEPAAHALYNQMIDAMRKADSLSYVSHYTFEAKDRVMMDCIYRAWLKKPNYFRVEVEPSGKTAPEKADALVTWLKSYFGAEKEPASEKISGVLIGDGNTLWIYWPKGRPQYGDETEADQKTRFSSYMKKPAPLAMHSIGHEVCYLGGMSMPIIDPSTFHGYTDSLQPYLEYVKGLGEEKVGDENCDKIELSIMKHQRSWFLWLSKNDHLPRKLKQIVRVSYDLVINEEWSAVTVNGDMPDAQFTWKPPDGWTEWKMPDPESRLLKPGAKAPEFDLASADGTKIKLSDYRDKVVWLYVWRAG